ncbi:MAG: protein-glutamate O-methyltransferase CheR [Anaerolineae bacterium]|nr:protein-glutamate O-methyltransferase CheR [Anaerolineae bacterium]
MTDTEFILIKKRLRALTGIDLESYKSPQMRRRLDGYLERVRAPSWAEFLRTLDRDPQAVRQLRDFLTINVTNFFRDRPKWEELRTRIVPLTRRTGHALRAWSAACSIGAEPFSLAVLFQEDPSIWRYSILGTDIDRDALEKARAGGPYTVDEVKEMDQVWLARYFRRDGAGYWVQPPLRQRVEFAEKDLLRSTAKEEFDLVVCRNVLIYFTEDAKDQVLRGLVQALRIGGVLFIGATESIPSGRIGGLERVSLSFYKRVA